MEAAKIGLIGHSRESLLAEIASIKAWDAGNDYPISVVVNGRTKTDSISNVENAINNDLIGYIEDNFMSKRQIIKTGGNDDLYLVEHPDCYDENKVFHKQRHVCTNFTPKKKKRKK